MGGWGWVGGWVGTSTGVWTDSWRRCGGWGGWVGGVKKNHACMLRTGGGEAPPSRPIHPPTPSLSLCTYILSLDVLSQEGQRGHKGSHAAAHEPCHGYGCMAPLLSLAVCMEEEEEEGGLDRSLRWVVVGVAGWRRRGWKEASRLVVSLVGV